MMLPYMTSNVKKGRKSISGFGGLNITAQKSDGELTDCKNTSGRHYPALSSRLPRGSVTNTGVNINGIGYHSGIIYSGTTDEDKLTTKIYYADKEATLGTDESEDMANRERKFAAQGDNVLIVPDNKTFSTAEGSVYTIEYSKEIDIGIAHEQAKIECDTYILNDPLYDIAELTSQGLKSTLHEQNGFTSYFMTFDDLRVGDVVSMSIQARPIVPSGRDDGYYVYIDKMLAGVELKITDLITTRYKTKNNGYVSHITEICFGENVLDKGGYTDVMVTDITLRRKVPPLEHICSLNNRVWGVYDNTIRCSKLGDCQQWYDFSADAYGTLPSSCFSTEVASEGKFTAIVPYGGGIVGFKENCLHKIYGTDPDSYTLSTVNCKGVKSGCANTVVTIGSAVYYMGVDGVYEYRGGMPNLVSKKCGIQKAQTICAGTDGKNYYLVVRENESDVIYVYYPESRVWHKEELKNGTKYALSAEGKMYIARGTDIECILGESSDENVRWSFVLEFDEDMYNTRSYGKLLVNYSLAKDGEFLIKTVCDEATHVTNVSYESNHSKNAYSVIPLPQMGCRDFRIEFEGKGEFLLKNITREYIITPEESSNMI